MRVHGNYVRGNVDGVWADDDDMMIDDDGVVCNDFVHGYGPISQR